MSPRAAARRQARYNGGVQPLPRVADGRFAIVESTHDSVLGRWTLVAAMPGGPLGQLVEAIWTSRGEGVFIEEHILPRTPTEVLFALGNTHWLRDPMDPARDRSFTRAFVSGLQTRPLAVESPADCEMAGVRLRPAGVAAFLRESPAAIAGAVVDLDAVLGRGVESLRDQLASEKDLRRRTLLLAAAIERHLIGAALPCPPIGRAVASLTQSAGRAGIAALVRATGWSHRHFTARFRAEIGVTPKAFARIARFEAAFARIGDQRAPFHGWADFAADLGYYDQAHLIREFRELAGATPAEVMSRCAPDGLGLLAATHPPAA
jgi:AraC-like DNA-binding protein